jgi:threonine synthase
MVGAGTEHRAGLAAAAETIGVAIANAVTRMAAVLNSFCGTVARRLADLNGKKTRSLATT